MIFPERMLRVEITIPENRLYHELEALGESGLLHVDRENVQPLFYELYNRAQKLLVTTEGFLRFLRIESVESGPVRTGENPAETLSGIETEIARTAPEINRIANGMKSLEKEEETLAAAFRFAEALRPDIVPAEVAEKLLFIGFKAVVLATEHIETFILALKRYDPFIVYAKMSEGSAAVAVFYEPDDGKHIETAVAKLEGREIPPDYFTESKREEVAKRRETLEREWAVLKRERGENLLKIYARLKRLVGIFGVQSALRKVGNDYLLAGWVPKKDAARFEKALKYSKIVFSPAGDDAPVLLKTPAILRSFETLIKGYSYPAYNEINPTVPFAFAFLVMVVAMFGDVGHGLVLMLAGAIVARVWPRYRDLGNIYILAGGGSVVFGFFYGSFFGFHHLIPHLFFSPIERVDLSIYTGIAIGIFFITLSFLINIFSLAKRREFSSLLYGEGGVLWLLIYWLAIGIAVKALVFELPVTVELSVLGAMVLLLLVLLLVRRGTVVETLLDTLIQMFEHAVNTISFARLGAFALAHGALFLALFSLADILAHADTASPGYWFIIILGNCFIIVLEGVVVTIQTLRLEYYEFFKRFFKGGGVPYDPYRLEWNR